MKTPRDILLERHAAVTPRLDALRSEVLQRMSPERRAASGATRPPISWAWRGLFEPVRWAWGGLAAAWILIALLHLARPEPTTAPGLVTAGPTTAPEQLRLVLAEQRQLRAELLGIESEPPQRDGRGRPAAPRPRSARNDDLRMI